MLERIKEVLKEEIRAGLGEILKDGEIDKNLPIRYVFEKIYKITDRLYNKEGEYLILTDDELNEVIEYGVKLLNEELRGRAINLIEKLRNTAPDLETMYILIAVKENPLTGKRKFKVVGAVFVDIEGLTKEELTKLAYHNGIIDLNNDYIVFKVDIKDFDENKYIEKDEKSRGLLSLVINILGDDIIYNVKTYLGVVNTITKLMEYTSKAKLN